MRTLQLWSRIKVSAPVHGSNDAKNATLLFCSGSAHCAIVLWCFVFVIEHGVCGTPRRHLSVLESSPYVRASRCPPRHRLNSACRLLLGRRVISSFTANVSPAAAGGGWTWHQTDSPPEEVMIPLSSRGVREETVTSSRRRVMQEQKMSCLFAHLCAF